METNAFSSFWFFNRHFTTSSLQNSKTPTMLNIHDSAKHTDTGRHTKSPVSVSWFPVPQHAQRPVPQMSKCQSVGKSRVAGRFWMWRVRFLAASWLESEIRKSPDPCLSLALVEGKHSDSHSCLCTLKQNLLTSFLGFLLPTA